MSPVLPAGRELRVLCLGAHADDIEIGCGGTLLRLLAGERPVVCTWVVFSATDIREAEARESAHLYLGEKGKHTVQFESFQDGYFPRDWATIKETFEKLKGRCEPDVVFTHYRDDRHQDHRVISDLTWNTFRRHWILEYEIPKFDGDLGAPNLFVPIPNEIRKLKIAHLMATFRSQRDKGWFSEGTFTSLLTLRGLECATSEGYAEAFYGRKTIALF